MPRDAIIEAIFTTADDQMQALWGLHRYLKATTDITHPESVAPHLPQRKFQITHEWARNYDPADLTRAICDIGIDFLLCRSALVSLVTICEAALMRFNARLEKLGEPRQTHNKTLLAWAFDIVQNSKSGSTTMLSRLPETCGDLDNARRLRNCIVHNNGCYSQRYIDDTIDNNWVIKKYIKDYKRAVAAREPIFLTTADHYEGFSRSHVEFLHILHNTIQQNFFGHADGYNYAVEGKRIEWYRILSGRRDVGM